MTGVQTCALPICLKEPKWGSAPDEERRDLVVELVLLAGRVLEADRAADCVTEVDLAVEVVGPGRRVRVWVEGSRVSRRSLGPGLISAVTYPQSRP